MKKQANPRSESPDRGTPFQLTNRPAESVSRRRSLVSAVSADGPGPASYSSLAGLLFQQAAPAAKSAEVRYVRLPELLRMLPMSASTVWRKVRCGTLPKPVRLSARVTAWNRASIIEWLAQREGQ